MPPATSSASAPASTQRLFTLGINASFHDSAAALLLNGEVIAAAEDERFTRIKHAKRPLPFTAWELPYHAIDFCLKEAGITLADVAHVAYSYDPWLFVGDRSPERRFSLPFAPSDFEPGVWENPWDPLFAAYVLNAPRQLKDGAPHHLRHRFALPDRSAPPYRWHFVPHHLCHQASAFLAAPCEHHLRPLPRQPLRVARRGACAAQPRTAVRAGDFAPGLSAFERRVQGHGAGGLGHAAPRGLVEAACRHPGGRPVPAAAAGPDRARRPAPAARHGAHRGSPGPGRIAAAGAGGDGAGAGRLAARGERRGPARDGRRCGAELRDERALARRRHLPRGVGAAGRGRRRYGAGCRAVGGCPRAPGRGGG